MCVYIYYNISVCIYIYIYIYIYTYTHMNEVGLPAGMHTRSLSPVHLTPQARGCGASLLLLRFWGGAPGTKYDHE